MAANTQAYTPLQDASTSTRAPRQTGANAADCRSEAIRPGLAPRPTLATATRYPALSGCPDLHNRDQLVEAIGYHGLALRLSARQKWTRAERMAIKAAVAELQADARASHQRALEIWGELEVARGLDGRAVA